MIHLKKDGIFYENYEEKNSENYVFNKVDSIIPYLNELLSIEYGFTLGDFFKIIEDEGEILNLLFSSYTGHYLIIPYLEEIKKDCMTESKEDLEHIEISWYCHIFPPDKDDKHGDNDVIIDIEIKGWGKIEENDEIDLDNEGLYNYYDVGLIPLYRIKHLPIVLNTNFEINDMDDDAIFKGQRPFSVFDVFSSVLSEISFAGSPEERDNLLKETIKEIDNYIEKKENEEGNKE
jgi:hypothetical protein